ncbi:hypothetical protein, partial [Myxococcus sp. AB025B]|uniref:hypothetical protein n=1 Tax=Myxococcus sp. AB025B TaxID=2562794 RepID=UPI001E3D79B0
MCLFDEAYGARGPVLCSDAFTHRCGLCPYRRRQCCADGIREPLGGERLLRYRLWPDPRAENHVPPEGLV